MQKRAWRIAMFMLMALSLGGCMTYNHIMRHYQGAEKGRVATAEGDFKVLDNRQEGRLFVTFAGMGTVTRGTPPLPWARNAAEAWLATTGRGGLCRITEGYLFQAPQYEFLYDCPNP